MSFIRLYPPVQSPLSWPMMWPCFNDCASKSLPSHSCSISSLPPHPLLHPSTHHSESPLSWPMTWPRCNAAPCLPVSAWPPQTTGTSLSTPRRTWTPSPCPGKQRSRSRSKGQGHKRQTDPHLEEHRRHHCSLENI
jgi:hypothetical protein